MTTNERFARIATANPATLARIDDILNGTDGKPQKAEQDCRLVTFTEAGRRLNLSRPTIYMLVKKGMLDTVPLDGISRIRLQSIFDYAAGRRS